MDSITKVDTIDEYCKLLGTSPLHPLVNVTYLSELRHIPLGRKEFGFYCVFFNEKECGTVKYGRGTYGYREGTALFVGPGQIVGVDDNELFENPQGEILMFHHDFIIGTSLGKRIKDFSFFAYDSNEALYMSDDEKKIIKDCLRMISAELSGPTDRHTKQIVCSEMETLFNYANRFYDRQFSERKKENNSVIHRINHVLEVYFNSTAPINNGVPTVQFCAREVCLSPNYFGDLVKRETGMTAQEFIHSVIVEKAKFHILETSMTISEIAYHLGFHYPHHLTRIFKKITGITPNQFRANLNK